MGSFCFPLLSGFLFVGSIYIKREPIIVSIEQDSGHDMGFGFEDLISKMVREKLFFQQKPSKKKKKKKKNSAKKLHKRRRRRKEKEEAI